MSSGNSRPDGVLITCISDTHNFHPEIPHGDILIHAGDFTNIGEIEDIIAFREYLTRQPHKKKIFISGNHEIPLEHEYYIPKRTHSRFHKKLAKNPEFDAKKYSSDCIKVCNSSPDEDDNSINYLLDQEILFSSNQICNSPLKLYGSPWQPAFGNMAFNLPRNKSKLKSKWSLIPSDLDVLITHTPPFGILDKSIEGYNCGCELLKTEVMDRVKPRLHIFGHIHESYGYERIENTLFVNASTCTLSYRPTNKPIQIYLPFDKSLPAEIVEE